MKKKKKLKMDELANYLHTCLFFAAWFIQ